MASPKTANSVQPVRYLTCIGLASLVLGTVISSLLVPGQQATAGGKAGEGTKGMVVSVSAPGSDVGLAILKEGGNAVDAAVATAFALAVTYPAAGNIGGGGFMVVHPGAKAEPVVIE